MALAPFVSAPTCAPDSGALMALLGGMAILGCLSRTRQLQARVVELEEKLKETHQHIHELDAENEFLEETVEHLATEEAPVPEPESPLLDDAIVGSLRKVRGKTVHEVLEIVKKVYPEANKKAVNSRLYTLSRAGLVRMTGKKTELKKWFVAK